MVTIRSRQTAKPRLGLVAAFAALASVLASGGTAAAGPSTTLRVVDNQLTDPAGQPVRLIGVNRSGAEYACIRGWGVFEGPTDAAGVQKIRSWYANAVRIGLNEDCWLGINGVSPQYGGTNYQKAVLNYVDRLTQAGMYVIVDLHWSAPGGVPATMLRPMPDLDHSVDFWQSVAESLEANPNVLFDVFNEPFGVDWDCWRDGCVYSGDAEIGPWQAVGMQKLVDTIRATGATQPILLGGLHFSNDLSEWAAHAPVDPLNQLVASFHVYPFNPCNDSQCWEDEVAPVAASVPIVVGEVGSDWTPPYSHTMAHELMAWADDHRLSYLAWTWNTWGEGDSLLTNYTGDPTSWGVDLKSHLTDLAVPRVSALERANAAYVAHDVKTALPLYDRVATTPPSQAESQSVSIAVTGLARFRALLVRTATGDEDGAQQELQALEAADPGAPLARLAAQFWDQYSMTASPTAACSQLAPQVDSQTRDVLSTLQTLGITMRHDELCVLP